MIALLKSDRFGMEIIQLICCSNLILRVKIRPFRYGNWILSVNFLMAVVLSLKSDRFGMEINKHKTIYFLYLNC